MGWSMEGGTSGALAGAEHGVTPLSPWLLLFLGMDNDEIKGFKLI